MSISVVREAHQRHGSFCFRVHHLRFHRGSCTNNSNFIQPVRTINWILMSISVVQARQRHGSFGDHHWLCVPRNNGGCAKNLSDYQLEYSDPSTSTRCRRLWQRRRHQDGVIDNHSLVEPIFHSKNDNQTFKTRIQNSSKIRAR